MDGIQNDITELWTQKPPHHQIKESEWSIEENLEVINDRSKNSITVQDEGEEWLLSSTTKYKEKTTTDSITSSETVNTSSPYPYWVRFTKSETDKQRSGGARSGSVVDPIRWCDTSVPRCYTNEAYLRTHASAAIYGSAWSHSRGYLTFKPHEDGNHTITAQYGLDGNSDTGATKMSIFARRHSDGAINSKIIDEPVTVDDEERSKYKQFNLNSNEYYDIGVELYSVVNASGSANSSDYYYSDDANGYRGARIRKHDDSSESIKVNT
ncbi:hypothetical protein [Natrinema amylolyticum]|uniref:hypothetical protein n=1 Tax=Natrinema amylolyticum TaxID=2878679 RepID=UPI001CF9FDD4|nr:hypothetical protein [Natrinema amylolyticum]